MMDQLGPCDAGTETFRFALASLNVVQVIILAYIGVRAKRKNDEDARNGKEKPSVH